MPANYLTGVAPPPTANAAGKYSGMTPENILADMRMRGWTQAGINALYAARGLSNPPTIPAALEGKPFLQNRSGALVDGRGNLIKGLSSADRTLMTGLNQQVTLEASDPYRQRTGISNFAGGLMNAVGTYVGGPVWTAMTAVADAGNNALGNNDGTSYTDGERSGADRVGSLVGSVAGSFNGPGSYGASNGANANGNTSGLPNGAISESGAGAGSNGLGSFGGGMGTTSGSGNLWTDLAQLGASLYNTYQQQQGSKDAANASIKGDANAIAEQRRQFDLARGDQMPWLLSGTAALSRLNDPSAFTASPGYAFTRAEGTRDIGNSFAARGGALSGNALRGLDAYNTGLASNEYNNWWNQQAGLAGVGQTSAQSLGGLGQNSANNVSNLLSSQGNARASGIVDQTNATTNGINDIANWYGNWMRNRQYGGG